MFPFLTHIPQTHKEYVCGEVVTDTSRYTPMSMTAVSIFLYMYMLVKFLPQRKLYPAFWFTWKSRGDKPIMMDNCNGIRFSFARVLQAQTMIWTHRCPLIDSYGIFWYEKN